MKMAEKVASVANFYLKTMQFCKQQHTSTNMHDTMIIT